VKKSLMLTLASSAAAWAQCSMCQTAAAAQSASAGKALNTAILILFVPAVAMFCGIFAVLRAGSRNDRQ